MLLNEQITSLFLDLAKTAIGAALTYIYTNRKKLKVIILCNTKYRNQDIRVSLSYLYKIKCKDKYLLVKNRKFAEQYQPVGGVYKYYNTAFDKFNKFGVVEYNGFNHEKEYDNDLRVKVPSKNLTKFIDWFRSREDRELDPVREFYEELIAPGYLPKDKFAYFNYRFLKEKVTPIKYSMHFKCNEILIYNIYELLPTEEQKIELEKLMSKHNDYYKWFDIDEIESLGHTKDGDYRVGEHTLFTK